MSIERSTRVVVDIVKSTDTVSGRVAVGDGAPTDFFGWIELIDRLQSAAGAGGTDAAPPAGSGGSA